MDKWEIIKEQIKFETKMYFASQNIDTDSLVDILKQIIEMPIDDKYLLDGLSSNYSDAFFKILNDETTQKEKYTYFEVLKNIEPVLKKILYVIDFSDFKSIYENKDGLFPILNALKLNPCSIELSKTNLSNYSENDYEYHLIKAYLSRNMGSHNSKKYTMIEFAGNIISLMIFYLETIKLHKKTLLSKLNITERVEYFASYVDKNGLPCGIKSLTKEQVSKRNNSYKFFYDDKNKLKKVVYINSFENPYAKEGSIDDPIIQEISYPDERTIKIRYTNSVGRIDYVKEFKKDFNGFFNRVNLYIGSEFSSFHLPSRTEGIHIIDPFDIKKTKANISGYKLERNAEGYIVKQLFLRYHNDDILQCDSDGIYGKEFDVNDKGQNIREYFLGEDGNRRQFLNAIFKKEYKYENDEKKEETHFSKTGAIIYRICNTINEHGNIICISFFGVNNIKHHKEKLRYNENGQLIEHSFFDNKNFPIVNFKTKCHKLKFTYDENGYYNSQSFCDVENKAIIGRTENNFVNCSKVCWENNSSGCIKKESYYDIENNLCECNGGTAEITYEYDSQGNMIEEKYFNSKGCLKSDKNGYAIQRHKFDKENLLIESQFYNDKQTEIPYGCLKLKYYKGNLAQNIQEIKWVDSNDILIENEYWECSKMIKYYDDRGLLQDIYLYDKNDELGSSTGLAHIHNEYNSDGYLIKRVSLNSDGAFFLQEDKNLDIKFAIIEITIEDDINTFTYKDEFERNIRQIKYQLDDNWNIMKETIYEYTETGEKIFKKRLNRTFDSFGYLVEEIYTDEQGINVIGEGEDYCKFRITYDDKYFIESKKYYDEYDNLVCIDGRNYAYVTRKHDGMGNIIEVSFFDENQRPSPMRFSQKYRYDSLGRPVFACFLEKNKSQEIMPDYQSMYIEYLVENDIKVTFKNKRGDVVVEDEGVYKKYRKTVGEYIEEVFKIKLEKNGEFEVIAREYKL